MRKIMLLVLLVPVVAWGQENISDSIKKYVKLNYDEISGVKHFESAPCNWKIRIQSFS